jgi:tetratricopeptide (TPR) repeat protein
MIDRSPATTSDLQRAEQLITAKEFDEALAILRTYWLQDPQSTDAVRLLSLAMKGLGRGELSGSLYRLSENEQALADDLPNLCEAGFHLIDAREMQLAVMVLQHCAGRMPDDATVSYELGFALMSLNKFAAALPYFQRSIDDFETRLNLCVCYMLIRQLEKAAFYVEACAELAKTDEEQKEVVHRRMVLKRLERFKNKPTLTPRDWAFILYGTLLLAEPNLEDLSIHTAAKLKSAHSPTISNLVTETAGKSGANTPDYEAVAWTLLILDKLLNDLGYEFDVIEFYSPLSRPLAEALAHKLDIPAKIFRGENNTDRTLLMMSWAPNIIGPHKSFMTNSRRRILFAYGLAGSQHLPLTPDVVAEICDELQMPWAQTSEENAVHRTIAGKVDLPDDKQAEATDKIVAAIAELESRPEIIQIVQQLADYYKPKVDQLVLGNPENFKERPAYTAEIVF